MTAEQFFAVEAFGLIVLVLAYDVGRRSAGWRRSSVERRAEPTRAGCRSGADDGLPYPGTGPLARRSTHPSGRSR